MKLNSQSLMAMTDADRGCRSMMDSSPAISPGPRMAKIRCSPARRSYDDFEKASFEPVATVAGIPAGKKRVTGTETTRFSALAAAHNLGCHGSVDWRQFDTRRRTAQRDWQEVLMAFMNARDQAHLTTYGQRDYRQWYNATTARIGWAWENVLFYGKGEFAVSTIESTILDSRGLGPGTGKKGIFGWVWGGGLEYVFNPSRNSRVSLARPSVLMRCRRRKEARAVLCPNSLARSVVRHFGAKRLAAGEFATKQQVRLIVHRWRGRLRGAIALGQFERAREQDTGEQDDSRGACDDLV